MRTASSSRDDGVVVTLLDEERLPLPELDVRLLHDVLGLFGMAVRARIVGLALVPADEGPVGVGDGVEDLVDLVAVGGLDIPVEPVGVELPGEVEVGLLDLVLVRRSRQVEDLIVGLRRQALACIAWTSEISADFSPGAAARDAPFTDGAEVSDSNVDEIQAIEGG